MSLLPLPDVALGIWDVATEPFPYGERTHQKIAWAREHIPEVDRTYRVEFYQLDGAFGVLYRYARDSQGRLLADRQFNAVAEAPVIVMLDELPDGQVILTELPDGRVRIDHADPRILISAELLKAIEDGLRPTSIGLTLPPGARANVTSAERRCGTLLKIGGVNRQVVYRITGYVPEVAGYIGE